MAGCNSAEFRPPPSEQKICSSRWKVAENRAECADRFGDEDDDVDGGECSTLMVQQGSLMEEQSTRVDDAEKTQQWMMKQAKRSNPPSGRKRRYRGEMERTRWAPLVVAENASRPPPCMGAPSSCSCSPMLECLNE